VSAQAVAGTPEVRSLPVADVQPDPDQHRKDFDPEKLAELGESIRSLGQLSPIVVRPEGGGYRIVAGERRWRAMQAAGFTTIQAVVRDLPEGDALALQAAENLARCDVRPCEEARAYRKVLDQEKIDRPWLTDAEATKRCASVTGSSPQRIAFKLKLLALPAEVQSLVDKGALGEGQAQCLVRLAEGEEKRAECVRLARKAVAQGLPVAEVRARVSAYLGEQAQGAMFAGEAQASPQARVTRDTLNRAIGHLARVVDLTFDERSVDFRLPDLGPNELDTARAKLAGAAKHLGALLAEVEAARGSECPSAVEPAPGAASAPARPVHEALRTEVKGSWCWVYGAPPPNGHSLGRDLYAAGARWAKGRQAWYAVGEEPSRRVRAVIDEYQQPAGDVP